MFLLRKRAPTSSMTKYDISKHDFTSTIIAILQNHFGEYAEDIFQASPLLGYINNKTRSANKGSKARGAFANHYALYVIVEDYLKNGFGAENHTAYSEYEGARFSELFARQRQLPFGAKLQNHALNSRLNDEFRKFYPAVGKVPIVRDVSTQRYWVQEDLLLVPIRRKDGHDQVYNISRPLIHIIDAYVQAKKVVFEGFLETCRQLSELAAQDPGRAVAFVAEQLHPNVDARVFEIVSYAVLKAKYGMETVWIVT